MAVVPADLLSPLGDLVPTLFPSDSPSGLAGRLNAYIAEGVAKAVAVVDAAENDRAVLHWAYYRAYKAIHVRMSGDPLSSNLAGVLQTGFSSEQIKNFASLRDEHLADFTALVPDDPEAPLPRPSSPPSGSTGLVFGW